MPFSNKTEISIYYEVHGKQGTPLLLVHGLGASKLKWPSGFIQQLAVNHQVIIFDNRGTGQSDKPQTSYTFEQFVGDALGVLDDAGFGKAYVMGVSMGGAVAQHLALQQPERVYGLILLGASFGGMDHSKAVRPKPETLEILAQASSGDEAQDTRNLWPIMYSTNFLKEQESALEEGLAKYFSYNYPATPGYARQLQFQMMSTHDTYDKLGDISCPTLVMTGEEDLIVPSRNAQIMAKCIPNAQIIKYSDTGHLAYVQKPEQVAKDIADFIQS